MIIRVLSFSFPPVSIVFCRQRMWVGGDNRLMILKHFCQPETWPETVKTLIRQVVPRVEVTRELFGDLAIPLCVPVVD